MASPLGLKIQLINKENVRQEYINFIRQLEKEDIKLKIDNAQMNKLAEEIKTVNEVFHETNNITQNLSGNINKINFNSSSNSNALNRLHSKIQNIKQDVDKLAKYKIDVDKNGQIQQAIITYKNELGKVVSETMRWEEVQEQVNGAMVQNRQFTTTKTSFNHNISSTIKTLEQQLNVLNTFEQKFHELKFVPNKKQNDINNIRNDINKLINDINNGGQVENSTINNIISNVEKLGKSYQYVHERDSAEIKKRQDFYNTFITKQKELNNLQLKQVNNKVGKNEQVALQKRINQLNKEIELLRNNQNGYYKKVVSSDDNYKNLIRQHGIQLNIKKLHQEDMSMQQMQNSMYSNMITLLNTEYKIKQKLIGTEGAKKQELEKQLAVIKEQQTENAKLIVSNKLQNQGKINEYLQQESVLKSNLTIKEEEELQKQIKKTNEIQRQIELYKQQMAIRLQNLKSDGNKSKAIMNSPDIAQQIASFENALKNLSTTNFDKGVLNNQFKQIEANIKSTNSSTLTLRDTFNLTFKKFGMWVSAASAFMAIIHEVKHGFDTVIALDKGLNNINLTLEGTTERFNNMGKSAMDFSLKLNGSLKNTMEAMAIFSNLNATVDEILEKSKPSMVLSNLTGNSISQSADALQAYIYTFDLTSNKASHLSDVITNLAANTGMEFTRSIESMTSAASRAGSVAHEVGLSAEQFMAIIATINEQSRLPGETIAAGLTTVMSRITKVTELSEEDVSKLETGFKSLGIRIRDNNGEFLNMWTILENINTRWGELNSTQKSYVAELAAGTKQKRIFLTLMNQFSTIQERAVNSIEAEGFAMERNDIYAKSITARFQNLRNVADEMWISLINRDDIKLIITTATSALSMFSSFAQKIGLIPTMISSAITVSALFNRHIRESVLKLISLENTIQRINNSNLKGGLLGGLNNTSVRMLRSIQSAFATLNTTIKINIRDTKLAKDIMLLFGDGTVATRAKISLLNLKLLGLNVTEKLLAVTTAGLKIALGALITVAITMAISKIITLMDDWVHHTEKLKEANDELIGSYKQNTQQNNDMITYLQKEGQEYETLSEKAKNGISLTTEENEKLHTIREKIASQFPELIQGYDEETGEVQLQAKSVKELTDLLKEKNEVENFKLFMSGNDILKEKYEEYKDIQNKIKNLDKEMNGSKSSLTGGTTEGLNEKIRQLKEEQTKYNQHSKESIRITEKLHELENQRVIKQKEINMAVIEEQNIVKSLQPLMSSTYNIAKLDDFERKLANLTIKPLDFIQDGQPNKEQLLQEISNFKTQIEKDPNFSTIKTTLEIENPKENDIKKYFEAILSISKTLKVSPLELTKIMPLKVDKDYIKKHAEAIIKILNNALQKANIKLDINNIFPELKEDEISTQIKKITMSIEEAEELFSKSIESIKGYNKYIAEMRDKGKLSAESTAEIIDKHSELIPYLTDEKTLYSQLQNVVKQEKDNALKATQAKLESNQIFCGSVFNKHKAMFTKISNAYGIDLENFKSIARTKEEINGILTKNIGNQWMKAAGAGLKGMKGAMITMRDSMEQDYLRYRRSGIDTTKDKDFATKIEEIKQLEGHIKALEIMEKEIDETKKKINTDFGSIGLDKGGKKSKKDSSSKNPIIFNGKELDNYEAKIKDINNGLESYDKIISNITQKISNLQSLESKSNYSDILAEQNKKLDEQRKKLHEVELDKERSLKYQKEIDNVLKGKFNWMKQYNLSKLTEEGWNNIYNAHFGHDINFGTDDSAKKKQEAYQEQEREFSQLRKNYIDMSNLVEKLSQDDLKMQQEINSTIKERFEIQNKVYDLEIQKRQKNIDSAQLQLNLFNIYEKENVDYIKKAHLIGNVINQQKLYLLNLIRTRNEMINHQKTLSQGALEWNLLNNSISEYQKQIDNMHQTVEQTKQSLEEVRQAQLNQLSNTQDKIVEALRKKYAEELKLAKEEKAKELLLQKKLTDEQLKLIKEGSKTALEIFEEEHNKKIELLNNELKAYEEIYQAKIKEIDRTEDKDTYEKDLNKKQQDKAKLQSQYDSLLMDSSLEAQAKREDLLESIKNKEEEINEFIHKRNITLRKRNLQDELEEKKKAIQKQIDEENRAYKKAKDLYDQEVKALEKSNEEKLKSEKLYAEARKLLMQNQFDTLNKLLNTYGENSEKIFGAMGNTIKQQITDNLKEAVYLMQNFTALSDKNQWQKAIGYESHYIMSDKEIPKNKMTFGDSNSGSYDWNNIYKSKEYKDLQQQFLNSKRNGNLEKEKDAQIKMQELIGKYNRYETGGLNDSTGWHWLDGTPSKPEVVLNAKETDAMLGLKKYLPPLLDSIKMPNISLPKLNIPNLSNVSSNQPIELKIEKLINIEGNADKSILPEIKQAGQNSLEQLKQALNKQGVRRVLI